MYLAAGLLAAVLSAGVAAWGKPEFTLPSEEPTAYSQLPSGRYSIKIIGLLTTTCCRAIEIEMKKLPEVESAKADFETETLTLAIKLDRTLKMSTLRKALHLAADRVNFGGDYFAGRVTFLP